MFVPPGDMANSQFYNSIAGSITASTLRTRYEATYMERAPYINGCMAQIFGRIMKADHLQLPPVKHGTGFKYKWTMVNERNMISVAVIVEGTGKKHIKVAVNCYRLRCIAANEPFVILLYLDKDCCSGKVTPHDEPHPTLLWWRENLSPIINLKLDAMHWLMRMEEDYTNANHLYKVPYLRAMSAALFMRDQADWDALVHAQMKRYAAMVWEGGNA